MVLWKGEADDFGTNVQRSMDGKKGVALSCQILELQRKSL